MGDPLFDQSHAGDLLEDPTFLAWTRKIGKPVTRGSPASDLFELLARYEYETREQRRVAAARSELARRDAATARGVVPAMDFRSDMQKQPQTADDDALGRRMLAVWRQHYRGDLRANANVLAGQDKPALDYMLSGHLENEIDRWLFARYYILAEYRQWQLDVPTESEQLAFAIDQEKKYLAEKARRAAAYVQASRPGLQRDALRAWARKQTLNPSDDFDPGIVYYALTSAAARPDWIDAGVKNVEQDGYTVEISYKNGKSIEFDARTLDFKGKYLSSIEEVFARRHKPSGRLVPFVLYAPEVDLYKDLPAIDALDVSDRVLMALPFLMTNYVAGHYAQDPMLQVAYGLTKVMALMTMRRGLPIAAPSAGAVAITGVQIGTRGVALVRGGATLARGAVTTVSLAVRTYGFSATAAISIGRSAYTFYLTNAVAINPGVIIGADIAFALSGNDVGPVNPGDSITMAAHLDDAVKPGVKAWKAIGVDVVEVDAKAGRVLAKVKSIDPIADDVAKAEYDLGKKLVGGKPAVSKTSRAVEDQAVKGRIVASSADDAKKAVAATIKPLAWPTKPPAKLPGPPAHFPFAGGKTRPVPEKPDTVFRIMSNDEAAKTVSQQKLPPPLRGAEGERFVSIDSNYTALFREKELADIERKYAAQVAAANQAEKNVRQRMAEFKEAGDAAGVKKLQARLEVLAAEQKQRAAANKAEADAVIKQWHGMEGQQAMVEIQLAPGTLDSIFDRSVDIKKWGEYSQSGKDVYLWKLERGYGRNIGIPKWQLDAFNGRIVKVRHYAFKQPLGKGGLNKKPDAGPN